MHSPERYLNGQITVTLRPKHLKREQKRNDEYLHHFYTGVAPGMGAKDVLKINGQIVFWIIVNDTTECLYIGLDTDGNQEDRFSVDFGLKNLWGRRREIIGSLINNDGVGYRYVT